MISEAKEELEQQFCEMVAVVNSLKSALDEMADMSALSDADKASIKDSVEGYAVDLIVDVTYTFDQAIERV